MIKKSILFIYLFITVFLFTTCKKYPDGPIFSLRRVVTRLAGTYVLDKYIVNGIDSTDLIPPAYYSYDLEHTSANGKYYYKIDRHHNIYGVDGVGLYYLSDNKKLIGLSYDKILYPSPNVNGRNILEPFQNNSSTASWEIRKLTNAEFWIKETVNGLTFEVHLKKIHKL